MVYTVYVFSGNYNDNSKRSFFFMSISIYEYMILFVKAFIRFDFKLRLHVSTTSCYCDHHQLTYKLVLILELLLLFIDNNENNDNDDKYINPLLHLSTPIPSSPSP